MALSILLCLPFLLLPLLLLLNKNYKSPKKLLHLGRIPTLVISSAEVAKQVMKDNDLKSCSRPSSSGSRKLTYNYRDMGFAPCGEYWREIRKICVLELFSVKRVQSYRAIREEEEVAKMITSISNESASSSSSSVDLTAKLFALMGSLILRVAVSSMTSFIKCFMRLKSCSPVLQLLISFLPKLEIL